MNKTQNILMEIVRDNADECNTKVNDLNKMQIAAILDAVSIINKLVLKQGGSQG
jgi:hypothetical protein